jgi:hypothetical protein
LARGIVVVAEKAPEGLAVAYTGVMSPTRLVGANASEYRMMSEQSEPAAAGPTDPDSVTVCPATTGFGLAWTTTRGVGDAAQAGAASSAGVPMAAANRRAVMIRTGRMAMPFLRAEGLGYSGP